MSINIRRRSGSHHRPEMARSNINSVAIFCARTWSATTARSSRLTRRNTSCTGALPAAALLPAILDGVEYDQYGKLQVTSGAAFGQLTWHLNSDRLALTGGVRFTRETQEGVEHRHHLWRSAASGGTLAPARLRSSRRSAVSSRSRTSDDEQLVLAGQSFVQALATTCCSMPRPAMARSPARPISSASLGKPVIIDPEKSTSYEAGMKTTFASAATFNVNLYWNDIKDFQATQYDPNRGRAGLFPRQCGPGAAARHRAGSVVQSSAAGSAHRRADRSTTPPSAPTPTRRRRSNSYNVVTSVNLSGTRMVPVPPNGPVSSA
jgi:iron complex outermembrane receptor protein